MTSILIVDDHPMIRKGLRALVEIEEDFVVVGEAASRREALSFMSQNPASLVLVDLGLEDGSGLDLIAEITSQHKETRCLVISINDESIYAERAFKAGARGYISKLELGDAILDAIHKVQSGELYMSKEVENRFAMRFLGGQSVRKGTALDGLTNRELEIFALIGRGESTRKIAGHLGRSIKTIESHREHIKQKLTLANGDELKRNAVRWVETGRVS